MPYLEVNGARLFYEVAGDGRPAFVFVHGGLCNHRDWAAQVGELGRDRRVAALDLRGHGASTGEIGDYAIERWGADLNALIDALALAPAVLTGHSLASRVVAEAAFQRPDNVGALVLLDGSRTYGGFSASEPVEPRDLTVLPSLADILEATVGPYADAATRTYVVSGMGAAPAELMQAVVEAMRTWDLERADTVFADLRPDLPVMAIQSTYHDRFVARRSPGRGETTPYLEFLKRARPDLRVEILPETGHFSMIEKSATVTALIRDFGLAAVPPGRG